MKAEQILPGTLFASISPNQIAAIELSIFLGQKIQADFPEIGNLYKEGFTLSMLISKFNLTSYLGVKFKVAESAIYRALKGYDGSMRILDIKPYAGFLSDEELNFYGKEHNRISGVKVGRESFEQKKGFFAFTEAQRNEVIRKSVVACGYVPYSKEELSFIEELALEARYKKGSLIKVSEIASEVNLKFHNGKEIRKPKSISKIRLRKKNKL